MFVKDKGYDEHWRCACLSHCRVFHLNVHPLSIEVTIPPQHLEVNRVMSADPHWSSPALWPRAGSPGCPSLRVSPPRWMQTMKTVLSAPCPPCPLSPLPLLPPPPPPPPTPSPPRPLAPACLQQLQAVDWGSSRRQETWLAGVGGTARSLSLTLAATSPSAWMMTASAPQTSSSMKSVQTPVWTCVLAPALKWMWLEIIVFPANEVTLWSSASTPWYEIRAPCWSCRFIVDEGCTQLEGDGGAQCLLLSGLWKSITECF